MADILCQFREETTQATLESGTAGEGALETRELGYATTEQEFSFRTHAGPIVHLPTRERLGLAPNAAGSGAKLLGYFPSAGLAATDVQAAIDELAAAVAGGGGGSGLGGGGVAGRVAYWTGATALDDIPFLDVVGSKLQFGGDAFASIYRLGVGMLGIDGGLSAAGDVFCSVLQAVNGAEINGVVALYDNAYVGYDLEFAGSTPDESAAFLVLGELVKNDNTARTFFGLRLLPTLNVGASNANTFFNVIDVDTINTALDGLSADHVNLLSLAFGGSPRLRINSSGHIISFAAHEEVRMGDDISRLTLCGGSGPSSSQGSLIQLSGVSNPTLGGRTRIFSGVGATIDLMGDTELSGVLRFQSRAISPAAPASGWANLYFRGSRLIAQYDDASTIRYKYLDLAGTGEAWVHTTTAP